MGTVFQLTYTLKIVHMEACVLSKAWSVCLQHAGQSHAGIDERRCDAAETALARVLLDRWSKAFPNPPNT